MPKEIEEKINKLTNNQLEELLGLLNLIDDCQSSYQKHLKEQIEGMKKFETKHERCTLDDNWCYNHQEIMDENDLPNGAYHHNLALSQVLTLLTENNQIK